MSYYSSKSNTGPGTIEGSALDGLRTRVAISVKRVLDSCSKQLSLENANIVLDSVPPSVVQPCSVISVTSTQVAAHVTNLQVTRLEERPYFARVRCNVTVPLKLIYKDANGDEYFADSQITIPQDIVMYVPEASVFPFEIVAVASCNCMAGKFTEVNKVNCTACLTVIVKVVAETDLLVPTYGFCPSPKAVDFEAQVCNKFFELPLYPSGK